MEVLSSTTMTKDLTVKLNLYLKSGVREYWIVDPDNKTVLQYVFNEEREIESLYTFVENNTVYSTAFPDLAVPLPEVFAELAT